MLTESWLPPYSALSPVLAVLLMLSGHMLLQAAAYPACGSTAVRPACLASIFVHGHQDTSLKLRCNVKAMAKP